MSVTIRNTTGGQPSPQPPTRTGGQPYGFEMIHGRWRTYADTAAELVSALIPGYAELDGPLERMQQRVRHAVDTQVVLQAELAIPELLDRCAAQDREILLGHRDEPPTPAQWDAPVPLVLVTSFYQPTGSRPRPREGAGTILWLDPHSDWSLLQSLHSAGAVHVAAHAPEAGAES